MSELFARVATTGIIQQGSVKVRFTREALESFPEQVAAGQAIPITVDHDPFCLPIGKVEEAWVEPFGEEYALVARIHIEDTYSVATHKRSGIDLVRLAFDDNTKPFGSRSYKKTEVRQDTLSVDLANFNSPQDYTAFANQVCAIDGTISCDNRIQRHAFGPEPYLHFVLSNPEIGAAMTVGVWVLARVEKFVRYTVDETLRKVADDISDSLSMKMKDILRTYVSHRSQDNRASLAQIVIPGNLELILLVKTEVDEEFPAIELEKLAAEMEKYGDILQEAESAVFARVGINDWKLQYVTTRSGQVIGTLECYERTKEMFHRMKQSPGSEDAPPGD